MSPGMRLTIILLFLAASSVIHQEAFSQQATSEKLAIVDARLEEVRDELIDFRRDLHKNPEVSGQERRTARKVSERLEKLGYDVRRSIGGHGVVAVLEGTQPGPVVAFRADMDAVYSDAPDPVDFASRVPGVRHICGHDIHTTIGVSLAEAFASIQDRLAGSVVLVFQPAEENVQGAKAMIDEGALDNPRPDAIFAVHTAPMETGQLGSKPGVMMARRGNLIIQLTGDKELSGVASEVVEAVRNVTTLPPGATSVEEDFILAQIFRSDKMRRGKGWEIRVGITTTLKEAGDQIKAELHPVLESLQADGVSYEMEYLNSSAAGVTNDPAMEQRARTVLSSVLGEGSHVGLTTVPTLFSEDFGLFQEEVPGVMYFLGVSNSEKGWVGMPHSPGYVADEESIFVGTRAMTAVMLDFMTQFDDGN